ncbi:hypothetical protein EV122DRAFT_292897 [Schizophyllum commune]
MSTRRRVGVPSAATTEAARRQLMQRVQVTWEKKLMPVEGSSLKAYKWIQINQPPQFSDDEDDVDEPLAPLPDEPDEDEPEIVTTAPSASESRAETAPPQPAPAASANTGSDAQPTPSADAPTAAEAAETSAMPPPPVPEEAKGATEGGEGSEAIAGGQTQPGELDLSGLGPDGLQLEGTHDLSQMTPADGLMAGDGGEGGEFTMGDAGFAAHGAPEGFNTEGFDATAAGDFGAEGGDFSAQSGDFGAAGGDDFTGGAGGMLGGDDSMMGGGGLDGGDTNMLGAGDFSAMGDATMEGLGDTGMEEFIGAGPEDGQMELGEFQLPESHGEGQPQ